jgi:hypothetical protein
MRRFDRQTANGERRTPERAAQVISLARQAITSGFHRSKLVARHDLEIVEAYAS